MNIIRLLIIGAKGRMGMTVADLAQREEGLEITGQCDLGDSISGVLPLTRFDPLTAG